MHFRSVLLLQLLPLVLCYNANHLMVRFGNLRSAQIPRLFGLEMEKDSQVVSSGVPISTVRRTIFASTLLSIVGGKASSVAAYSSIPSGFKRIPTQFIAALGDPKASDGSNANEWGLWRVDPGPRGVRLQQYNSVLEKNNLVAPAGWKFNPNDWWLEEHGLIMEPPTFPLPAGRYLVTGGRAATAVLSVGEPTNSNNGKQQSWSLDGNVKLFDVTHLPCRSARYTPITSAATGSPLNARAADFPVSPGAPMPSVQGTNKQDYAVLFVIGVEDKVREL